MTPTTHPTHPKHHTLTTLTLTLLTTILIAGCGSSATKTTANTTTPTQTTTPTTTTTTTSAPTSKTSSTPAKTPPAEEEKLPSEENVYLTSAAFKEKGALPARYTCDGQNTPPPLHWTGVPKNTQELALYIIKIKPEPNHTLHYAWAITNINPHTTSITNGKPPPGATTGNNTDGNPTYNLCPPKNTTEHYVAALYTLPHHQHTTPNFNPETQRQNTLHHARYEALLQFTYTRH